jgi:DNA-binding transcriptional regulator YhcF (GntR family)/predicted kinase
MAALIPTTRENSYMAPDPTHPRAEAMYERVARGIRTDIEAGRLRHEQVLPSTRELATQWKVSVHTISEAMKVLVKDGKVISTSRSKRVVHAPEQEDSRGRRLRLHRPAAILIGGYAGSGKSELARIIARESGWPVLDKDTITRPVVEAALEVLGSSPHDRESDTYLSVVRPREYEALDASTREQVECGNSVVASAPYIREFGDASWVQRMQASYAALDAQLVLVWVHCDPESMHTYLRRRGAARDAAKLAAWDQYLASIDLDLRPPVDHVVIENSLDSAPLQTQAAKLIKEVMATQ